MPLNSWYDVEKKTCSGGQGVAVQTINIEHFLQEKASAWGRTHQHLATGWCRNWLLQVNKMPNVLQGSAVSDVRRATLMTTLSAAESHVWKKLLSIWWSYSGRFSDTLWPSMARFFAPSFSVLCQRFTPRNQQNPTSITDIDSSRVTAIRWANVYHQANSLVSKQIIMYNHECVNLQY